MGVGPIVAVGQGLDMLGKGLAGVVGRAVRVGGDWVEIVGKAVGDGAQAASARARPKETSKQT